MFANRKLMIGAFLASLAVLTIVGHGGGSAEDALTGQLLPLPSFPFARTSSSSSVTSASSSVAIDERAAEGFSGEGGVFGSCSGYENLFPKEYASVSVGKTLVDGLWWGIFTRERDRILEGHAAKTETVSRTACRKVERDIVMNMTQLAKLYECALTDESRNLFFQAERVLSAQRGRGTNREPLTILDVWNYIQDELQHIEQSMSALRAIREFVLSSAFSRCSSEQDTPAKSGSSRSSSLHSAAPDDEESDQDGNGSGGEWGDDSGGGDWGGDSSSVAPPQEEGVDNGNDGGGGDFGGGGPPDAPPQEDGGGNENDGGGGDFGGGGGDWANDAQDFP